MPSNNRQLQAILEAIEDADLPRLNKLLGSANVNLNQTWDERLPLVEAVRCGPEFIRLLLEAGADVNGRDEEGSTALIQAAGLGSVPVLKALLAAGADPNLMEGNVVSPLRAAAGDRSQRHLEALKCLIAAGADVNILSRSQEGVATGTVLMTACRVGNLEGVRELIAAGADVNARVSLGTALTKAAEEGHEAVVKALLEAGADPTARLPDEPARLQDKAGKTALEIARDRRHRRVVALLEGTADVPPARRSASVAEAWQRLETALAASRPAVLKTFRPGASAEDRTALAAALGRRLPPDLEEFFRVHDGQSRGARSAFIRAGAPVTCQFRLLPIRDVIREWRLWNDLLTKGEFRGRKSLADPGVINDWYHPGWVPLTEDGEGDNHCLDLAPAPGGQVGQVILMWHDQEARPVVAKSLAEWLDELAKDYETA